LTGCRGSRGRCSPLDKGTAPPAGHAGMLRRSGDSQATPQQSLGPWEARLVDKRRFRLAERTAEFMLLLLNFCCCAAALLPRQPIGRPALGDTAALRLVGGRAGSGDGLCGEQQRPSVSHAHRSHSAIASAPPRPAPPSPFPAPAKVPCTGRAPHVLCLHVRGRAEASAFFYPPHASRIHYDTVPSSRMRLMLWAMPLCPF